MARRFNGINQTITYGHIPAFNGRGTLGVGFWFKPLASTAPNDFYAAIISQENNSASTGFHIGMGESNIRNLTSWFRDNDVNESACDSGTNVFDPDVFQHVYMIYDGSQGFTNTFFDDRIKTWKNGVQINPPAFYGFNDIPPNMGTISDIFRLGHSLAYGAGWWPGELAEIGIWLDNSQARIAGLAAGQAPSFFQPNLHVYIPLLQAGGAEDVKGNAGTPTIIGATAVPHPAGITYPGGSPTNQKFFFWETEKSDAEWLATGNDTPGGTITRV